MKHIFLMLLLLLSPCMPAQKLEPIKLWSADPAAAEAELFVYPPATSATPSPAILICPGGGYGGLAMDHEGHQLAKWFASEGFVAVVLKYRMPNGIHTIPLSDAEKAISTLRDNAKQWNIDVKRVGVIGSSAGGHLAASLSTLAADANRPDFAILYYPVISFDDKITHSGTKSNLLGKEIGNKELVTRYTLQEQVNEKTPKTLIFQSDDDTAVPPANSILYYTALQEKHIPAALYTFPVGGHGWGFNESFPYHEDVKTLTSKWLKFIKML